MDARSRDKIVMSERVLDFTLAHPLTAPGEIAVMTRLGQLIDRAHTLDTQYRTGRHAVRAATARRKDLITEVNGSSMTLLIATAQAAAKELPQLGTSFGHIRPGSHKAFLAAAHGMVAEATTNRDLFIRYGMSDPLLDDILAKLNEIEEVGKRFNAGRRDHTGATADLDVVIDDIMTVVAQLGAMYLYRFKDQPEKQAAWKSARNVPWPIKDSTKAPPAVPNREAAA